jgi:hypothetical protein
MTSYFGIIPSDELKSDIQLAQANRSSSEPQYPLRDKISLRLTDELIDTLLAKLVHEFPPSEKRDTVEENSGKMLQQLLGKTDNKQVLESLAFMEKSLFIDNDGNQRIGMELPDTLVNDIKASFAEVLAGNGKAQRETLVTLQKSFADNLIHHFMTEYNKTLGLGMVKRGVASVATSAVSTVVHFVIGKLIPSLSQTELEVFAKYYGALLIQK